MSRSSTQPNGPATRPTGSCWKSPPCAAMARALPTTTCIGLCMNGAKRAAGEWFQCTVKQVQGRYLRGANRQLNEKSRSLDFEMRPEQEAAVEKTAAYFESFRTEKGTGASRRLPLECKDAFRQDLCRLSACQADGMEEGAGADLQASGPKRLGRGLESHVDFNGWQFI